MSVFRERHARYEVITALLRLGWTLTAVALVATGGHRYRAAWPVLWASLLYGVAMLVPQVRAQVADFRRRFVPILLDGLLGTLLVGLTGGGGSPFLPVYLLGIVAYGLRLRLRGGLLVGAGCLALLWLVAFLTPGNSYHALAAFSAYAGLISLAVGIFSNEDVQLRLRLEEANRQLKQLVNTDELTGLYNYRYFQERLREEVDRADRYHTVVSLMMLDVDDFKAYNDLYGHVQGDHVLRELAKVLRENVRSHDVVARYGGEEFAVILTDTQAQPVFLLGERIRQTVAEYPFYGEEELPGGKLTVSIGIASYPTQATSKAALVELADQALYRAKQQKNKVEVYLSVLEDLRDELETSEYAMVHSVQTLMAVIDAKDRYTYQHSERVVEYAEEIGRRMGLPQEEIKYLRYAAFLHDVGKIEVSKHILCKGGALSAEDWEIIRQHPAFGADLVSPIRVLRRIVPLILYHQENYDGSGYPFGLRGEEIPLGARILRVADSFDAMTSERPYRPARSLAEAEEEIRRGSGSQFDPRVCEVMLGMIRERRETRQAVRA